MDGYQLYYKDLALHNNVEFALSLDMTLAGITDPGTGEVVSQTSPLFSVGRDGNPIPEGVYRVYWRYLDEEWKDKQYDTFLCGNPAIDAEDVVSITVIEPIGSGIIYGISNDGTIAGIGHTQTGTTFTVDANGDPLQLDKKYYIFYKTADGAWTSDNAQEASTATGYEWPDFMTGQGLPSAATGTSGLTHYLDTLTKKLYKKEETGWIFKGGLGDPNHYSHVQTFASSDWAIGHNLGYKPGGIVVHDTAGNEWEPDVTYVDNNNLILHFGLSSFTGTAELS
nr:hypothetical protein [uncultured Arsenicibacter sp.]